MRCPLPSLTLRGEDKIRHSMIYPLSSAFCCITVLAIVAADGFEIASST